MRRATFGFGWRLELRLGSRCVLLEDIGALVSWRLIALCPDVLVSAVVDDQEQVVSGTCCCVDAEPHFLRGQFRLLVCFMLWVVV